MNKFIFVQPQPSAAKRSLAETSDRLPFDFYKEEETNIDEQSIQAFQSQLKISTMDARFYVSASGSEIQEGKSDASIGPDDEGKKEEELESRKAEMIEVREENARLRTMLNQIEKNYRSLQMRFIDVFQQQSKVKINPSISREDTEEPDLVSLRLGRRNPGESKQDENITSSCKTREDEKLKQEDLKLGLDYNKLQDSKSDGAELGSNPSHENSLEEITKQERVAGETWPPSKAVKTMRSGEDELSEQSSVKRARVSVRARCDAPTVSTNSPCTG
ncbi:WRKY transcription factor [Sarracenia purpurea var. burkii]